MKAVQLLRHEPFGYRLQRECVTSSSSLVLIQRGLSRCCAPQPAFYLALGLEPIFQIVTVCPSALLVKFVGALLDLLLDGDQASKPAAPPLTFLNGCSPSSNSTART